MGKPQKVWLSEDQEKILRILLWQTWEYIGNDLMSAVQEEGRHCISQADLIEVVLDADHVQTQVRKPEEKQAVAMLEQMDYKDRIKFAKTVFRDKWYS